ncbi:MAG: hypothetical protein EBE86_021370 [Hormoscilla sp. GUM202]|nr:hypothetical protein [Hormoscilla sp. GUM202]
MTIKRRQLLKACSILSLAFVVDDFSAFKAWLRKAWLRELQGAIAKQFLLADSQRDPLHWLINKIRADFAQTNTVRFEG